MTPLAHRIARELTLPKHRQRIDDRAQVLGRVGEAIFFDAVPAEGIIEDRVAEFSASEDQPDQVFRGLAFLPNKAGTWIELPAKNDKVDSGRIGLLLRSRDGGYARVDQILSLNGVIHTAHAGSIPLDGSADLGRRISPTSDYRGHFNTLAWYVYASLSVINSPRRINQRVLMMHKGLARDMRRKGVAGIFPANAYREITLHAMPEPVDASDAAAWRDYNSNRMPLHFVRAHRRREDGVLNPKYDPNDLSTWDLVEAHWRGNAAFGIKLKKYRVAA